MKQLIFAGCFAMSFQILAQSAGISGRSGEDGEFTFKPTGDLNETVVLIENLFSDMEIIGTSSAEIRITVKGYEGLPEKAKGLKPLSSTGPENTNIGLYVAQEGENITISGASRVASKSDYTIYLPQLIKMKLDYSSFQAGDVKITGLTNEVEVKSQIGELTFKDVTGPIIASTLSSDISVEFSVLNQTSPTSLTSTSGDIDITLPANSKGDFKMSTTSGEVYTDMDFDFDEEEGLKRFGGGMSARANLNGGGAQVTLRCVSGDIFIRKGN